ncbi:MAG: type II toxin-antitoxin system VapC family toxin [Thermoflexaceae bacterium]|nr:type II toxin-antitoxin system VapC family toxin [Thermoflexaceae bacterium]
MRFWDSSALMPLLVEELTTPFLAGVHEADPDLVVWWASVVECVSVFARLQRDGLPGQRVDMAVARLARFRAGWREILPSEEVRETAMRLLRVHPLRAAEALQLAAGLYAAEGSPGTLEFVCLDARLGDAAHAEGFVVVRA